MQKRVLEGAEPITCRPADLIEPEMDRLTGEMDTLAKEEGIKLCEHKIDDVLTYALFGQVGIHFLKNRNNPAAFEPAPGSEPEPAPVPEAASAPATVVNDIESYRVSVNGTEYDVVVGPGNGDISQVTPAAPVAAAVAAPAPAAASATIKAPLAGNIIEVLVSAGQQVQDGDPVFIIEAMKMETEIRSHTAGTVQAVLVGKGDSIKTDQDLVTIA